MADHPDRILAVIDSCCESFTFPMLDNGYVYLAASRLTAYRSENDWALVIEIFGYSPRAGHPDIHVYTFGSKLVNRIKADNYVSEEAYRMYLANNPHNESRFFHPVDGQYQADNNDELVSTVATQLRLRNEVVPLPDISRYLENEIELVDYPRIRVFELCRYLAAIRRDDCLATETERRINLPTEMRQLLCLDEWRHPDLLNSEMPSSTETFQHLAKVLWQGDASQYKPSESTNTHWKNWPEGGSL